MAHQWYRGNLSAAKFPFATPLWGRSVIMPQLDQNYDRVAAAYNKDDDKGIPQAFYMENVLPTAQGYMSIGYDTIISGIDTFGIAVPLGFGFDTIFELRYNTPEFVKFLFSPAGGQNWVYNPSLVVPAGNYIQRSGWRQASPFAYGTFKDLPGAVTVAFVNGISYIYYANLGCYVLDQTTVALTLTALTGLTATAVEGICTAAGYMIAYDENSISWSSATSPVDFVPSLITGAGGGSPQFTKGKIKFCLPISGGFLIYCEKNVVSATYSGNIRFPFIFAEVAGSGGCDSPEKVSWTSNLSSHYAWTTAGLQEITKSTAIITSAEATDFLAGGLLEELTSIVVTAGGFYDGSDAIDVVFTESFSAAPLHVGVSVISDRWLVVSYGTSATRYDYALVQDLTLKRWGKLKITHTKCFEWPAPNLYGAVTYGQLSATTYGGLISTTYGDLLHSVDNQQVVRKQIAFLRPQTTNTPGGFEGTTIFGRVDVVNFDFAQSNANGVLLLGKFQVQRNKTITHQDSDIETSNFPQGIVPATVPPQMTGFFDTFILPSFDGRTLVQGKKLTVNYGNGVAFTSATLVKRYSGRISGLNIVTLLRGAFNVNSYLMNFTIGGDR